MNIWKVLRVLSSAGSVLLFLCLFGEAQRAVAQPVLDFKRLINNWPTVELYFTVTCNGQPGHFTDRRFLKVHENGIEIDDFQLWCPDPYSDCAVSVALVFDVSSSMAGSGIAGAKDAGNAFIDNMDGLTDEAIVIAFNTVVTVVQGTTIHKDLLHNAINGLSAGGNTAVWDGIYVGIEEVLNNGVNPCKTVISLTDGEDNSSSRLPDDCTALANRNHIRVFTIGLGTALDSSQLKNIATLTGGRYYQTSSPSQLAAIYREISRIISAEFEECSITYTATCTDGGLRTVDLSVVDFCGGSDTKTGTYRAPKDTSTYTPVRIELGKAIARGNDRVTIPLELTDPLQNEILNTSTFTVLFDEQCARFDKISTPPGTLLDGVPIAITPFPGGVTFATMYKKPVNGSGILASLDFTAADPTGTDTVCCNVTLANWTFDAGCFRPVLGDGQICVVPRQPLIACTASAPPQLTWDPYRKDYSPNPFTIRMQVGNSGDREATNCRFQITKYNSNEITLVAPIGTIQDGNPHTVDPGDSSEAQWDVLASPRVADDTIEVCVTATFDNHDPVTCCVKVWIPQADAMLRCTMTAPTITADQVNLRYVPMPFGLVATVLNAGGRRTDTVWARIVIPPTSQFKLAGADAPSRTIKKVLPPILNPGAQGSVSWTLMHPITDTAVTEKIGAWVHTSNADSSYCEVEVNIPGLAAPKLQSICLAPDSLHYDENADAYTPNPFNTSLRVTNIGGLPASNVTAFLYLPADVSLDPGDPGLRKNIAPDPLDSSIVGTVTWKLVYGKKYRYDTFLDFTFVVGGVGPTGHPLDSAEVQCRVRVPGPVPSFACAITMPDSCGLNAQGNDVVPNPFDITYHVWNTGARTGKIVRLALSYPAGIGVEPDSSTQPVQTPNRTMNPGDTLTYTWRMNVANRITRRDGLHYTAIAYDDAGDDVPCDDTIDIAGILTALACDVQTSEPVLRYLSNPHDYAPKTFIITATLSNSGVLPLSNAEAEIGVDDPSGLNLVEFDPAFAGSPQNALITIPTILTGQGTPLQWGFRLKNPNTGGIPQYPLFSIRYRSDETPDISRGCAVPVRIDPVATPKLVCQIQAPDLILYNAFQDQPPPFDVRVKVQNIGNGDAYNTMSIILWNERFTNMSSPIHNYGRLAAGATIDFTDFAGSLLSVNPWDTDGYDTLRVVCIADGIDPSLCIHTVLVQREPTPAFRVGTDIPVSSKNGMRTPSGDAPVPPAGSGRFALQQNIPNPFNPSTVIAYTLAGDVDVRLTVYDALGREVRTLVHAFQKAGAHAVIFDAKDLPSGTYFSRLETPKFTRMMRMILAR